MKTSECFIVHADAKPGGRIKRGSLSSPFSDANIMTISRNVSVNLYKCWFAIHSAPKASHL